MEYCGAGSVSDIIRLRNKTVRTFFFECYKPEMQALCSPENGEAGYIDQVLVIWIK